MSVAFDTLKYANELEKVNFSKDQAEKLAILQKEIIDKSQDDLATKKDLLLVKSDLEVSIAAVKTDLKVVKSDLQSVILQFKNEMIMWVVGSAIAQCALIFTRLGFVMHK